MLDVSYETEIDDLWESLKSKASLPGSLEEYYAKSGPKSVCEHRAYDRHYLRCVAIMQQECEKHAIYMKDCSRAGMGIISPVQLFPRQQVQIWMNPQRSYALEVVRCRRVRQQCYECGTIFVLK